MNETIEKKKRESADLFRSDKTGRIGRPVWPMPSLYHCLRIERFGKSNSISLVSDLSRISSRENEDNALIVNESVVRIRVFGSALCSTFPLLSRALLLLAARTVIKIEMIKKNLSTCLESLSSSVDTVNRSVKKRDKPEDGSDWGDKNQWCACRCRNRMISHWQ